MTLPYLPRLLCLCFSFFFLLNAASSLLVRTLASNALRFAGTRRSSLAATFLLAVRLLPFALATLFVVVLCVPSYVRLEPAATAEYVGLTCVTLGSLGLATWSLALVRAVRAMVASALHRRRIARMADTVSVGELGGALVLDSPRPLLALAGLFQPRLLISRTLLQSLSPAELDAALTHEQAHRVSRDNLKRLLFLLAPDVFPFCNPLRTLEQSWCKFTEWAADDRAAAGDSQRALSLAAALVRVARLGASPTLPYLATSLLASDRDLEARVDRLLRSAPEAPFLPNASLRARAVVLLSAIGLAGLLLVPAALSLVHELQELLVR